MSLQAVNWMLFMTFGIASLVVAFHKSHYMAKMPQWFCHSMHDLWEPALIWPKGDDHDKVPFPSYWPAQDELNVSRWEGIHETL